jgi:hypothetical protein
MSQDHAEFFLSSPPSVAQLDCLEISHPDFSQTYRIVRNDEQGVSVTHEGPDGPYDYDYYPARVLPIAASDDLVQALSVTLGDLGDVIAAEIANVWEANGMNTRPSLTWRAYRSDDLSEPMAGPIVLEIVNVNTTKEGCSFEARAPELNASRTGALYSLEQFPMLRAFL